MKKLLLTYLLAALAVSAPARIVPGNSRYVDPRIGTAPAETNTAGMFGKNTEELGQTLPAVLSPNGMNFWTPQTRDTEKKCVAPYYYTDSLLQGFRNSHWIVGGCTQDYGSMTIMPLFGMLRTSPASRASRMDKLSEISRPDFYSIHLPDEHVTAEMTATSRAAIFNFDYDENGFGYLVINPNSDEGQGYVEIDIANRQIRGYNPVHRIYQGKGQPAGFCGWFVIEWPKSMRISDFGTFKDERIFEKETKIYDATGIGAFIKFRVRKGRKITVKAASSFTGMENAIANLNAEIPHFDFDRIQSSLCGEWNDRLALIDAHGGSESDKRKFYSALYRASFLPHEVSDADGSYPSFASGLPVRKMPGGKAYYDGFSLWDTFRSLHPLLNIIAPSRSGDMMQSLVLKYEQGGWLPIFPCWNSYTAAMIGDHAAVALADAAVKGISGFDMTKAYEGMRKNAFKFPDSIEEYRNGMGRRALDSYLRLGYIPDEDSVPDAFHKREQVSRTLEYAFDDFAVAQMARLLGEENDFEELSRRALNYRNAINPATGYAAPRKADGTFLPADPFAFNKCITEGAPCHYTWFVPHDQTGLMEIMGGRDAYAEKLDSMFSSQRYWHGNEPCHQVAWLFPFAGEPWKTQKHVRHIMETEYLDSPGGLSGNDDAGQMSAWYVFAALGFYPVCPASDEYIIGAPAFPEITLNLENGNKFQIVAEGLSHENIYVESVSLNDKPITDWRIRHSDIMAGGTLHFKMTASHP